MEERTVEEARKGMPKMNEVKQLGQVGYQLKQISGAMLNALWQRTRMT